MPSKLFGSYLPEQSCGHGSVLQSCLANESCAPPGVSMAVGGFPLVTIEAAAGSSPDRGWVAFPELSEQAVAHIIVALRLQNRWAPPRLRHGLASLLQLVPHPWPPAVCRPPATVAAYLVDAADTLADVGSGLTHRAREKPTPRAARAGW